MSTIAPERPDTVQESAEDAALLARLDPDLTCARCSDPAAMQWLCAHCRGGTQLCLPHHTSELEEIAQDAVQHVLVRCPGCSVTFCAHRWRSHILHIPIGAGS